MAAAVGAEDCGDGRGNRCAARADPHLAPTAAIAADNSSSNSGSNRGDYNDDADGGGGHDSGRSAVAAPESGRLGAILRTLQHAHDLLAAACARAEADLAACRAALAAVRAEDGAASEAAHEAGFVSALRLLRLLRWR